MPISITWLSHASWLIEVGSVRLMLDPFLTDNPAAINKPSDYRDVNYVLLSHGHFDHLNDVETIARANQATIVTNFEIANWYAAKGFGENDLPAPLGMNLGGQTKLGEIGLKMVPAVHSSGLPDGSDGGTASGFIVTAESKRIYFACDTAYFSDMRHYAHHVDLAVLPIGDLFTMGIDDCLVSIQQIEPKRVLPTHYNTWPPIAQDAAAWADRVRAETTAEPIVLEVGGSVEV
ncbi:MAG: metal-dependent hydrolase [Planctomycetota bacterium]